VVALSRAGFDEGFVLSAPYLKVMKLYEELARQQGRELAAHLSGMRLVVAGAFSADAGRALNSELERLYGNG